MDPEQPDQPKPDLGAVPPFPGDAAKYEPEKQKASFNARFDDDGVLRMEMNLNDAAENEDKRMILYTFMTELRDKAMGMIFQRRALKAQERSKLISLQNKNGHKSFINKLFSK